MLTIRDFQEKGEELLYDTFSSKVLFDETLFRNKRVLIVGAADFVQEEIGELRSTQFDLVVKFNGSFDLPLTFCDGQSLRCDLLFSNLLLNPNLKQLVNNGLQRMIIRVPRKVDFHIFYRFFLRNLSYHHIVKLVHIDRWNDVGSMIDHSLPTSGFLATMLALEAEAISVHMVGFSFFKTEWVSGHSPWSIESYKVPEVHNPDLESQCLKDLILDEPNVRTTFQSKLTVGNISQKWLAMDSSL